MIGSLPTRRRPQPPHARPSEEGYILVWVVFLLAVFALAMSVAAPRMAREIQRDRERENMERGKQYTRAIKLYYGKYHAYPPSLDALVKTQEIRFLRKKYVDLSTGKAEWKPIMFGQNKVPMAMGFFGQPLAGSASTIAGVGPSGGNQSPGGLLASPDPSATQDPNNPAGASGATGSTGSTIGQTGQTFGGAGIVGVSPMSSKQSILVYKKKNHYNEWEFTYDPLSEMKVISSSTGVAGASGSTTSTSGGSQSPPPSPFSPQQ